MRYGPCTTWWYREGLWIKKYMWTKFGQGGGRGSGRFGQAWTGGREGGKKWPKITDILFESPLTYYSLSRLCPSPISYSLTYFLSVPLSPVGKVVVSRTNIVHATSLGKLQDMTKVACGGVVHLIWKQYFIKESSKITNFSWTIGVYIRFLVSTPPVGLITNFPIRFQLIALFLRPLTINFSFPPV